MYLKESSNKRAGRRGAGRAKEGSNLKQTQGLKSQGETERERALVNNHRIHSLLFHLISSAEKLTIVGMKFSLMMMERICFQSVVLSPRSKQMDSRASFTAAGGLAMERTSTRCCFLMDLTAINIR